MDLPVTILFTGIFKHKLKKIEIWGDLFCVGSLVILAMNRLRLFC